MNNLKLVALFVLLMYASIRAAEGRCTVTVRLGSRSDCVRVVQRAVGTIADGIFGQNTNRAVINFQRSRGLAADGIVGRNTWAAIYSSIEPESGNSGAGNSGAGNGCGCTPDSARRCSNGPTAGARNLADYLHRNYGSYKQSQIYHCRNVRGGSSVSLHGEGRAVDYFTSGSAGTEIFNHLIQIACNNGIQDVIFNRQIWTSRGIKPYYGPSHTDHIHVSLNRCGATSFNL